MKRLIAISLLIFLGLQASGQRLIPFLPEPEKSNGIAVINCHFRRTINHWSAKA